MNTHEQSAKAEIFNGNIFILHSFDIGEDINIEKIKDSDVLVRKPLPLSKYFKNYHIPLAVELPNPASSPHLVSAKIHNFGVITMRYQIPFSSTLEEVRARINDIDYQFQEQSVADAGAIFQKIKSFVIQPKFFHLRCSYDLIQVNTKPERNDVVQFKHDYGNVITSLLRFETETLSDYQRNEILADAIGYYQGDLILIDSEAAFAYDDEYDEKLEIIEFANIQFLELQYFDRVLDKKLNVYYEGKLKDLSWRAYLPVFGGASQSLGELERVKVDISVITDRLENSVKLAGDAYYSELYALLFTKLGLKSWRESLSTKLSIIQDISYVHQNRIESGRQDFLSWIIIVLIFIELLVALLK